MTKLTNNLQINGKQYQHKVHIFNKPFLEGELPLYIERNKTQLDDLLDVDAKKYEGIIPNNFGYKEKVLLCPNKNINLETIEEGLELHSGTSYQLTAWRKDPNNHLGVNPGHVVSVHGITITLDNYLVFGRRGGNTSTAGQGETAPGGNLSDEGKDPLFNTYYMESIEELDIDSRKLIDARIVAVQNDPHFRPTLNFIFTASTSYTFSEVNDMHRKAMSIVKSKRRKIGNPVIHDDARKITRTAGLRNIDAWEKDYLVGIPLEKETLEKCVNTKTIPGNGETLHLLSSSLGDLQVALELMKQKEL